jgi:transcriptional regulator with XRE-family HTH domain
MSAEEEKGDSGEERELAALRDLLRRLIHAKGFSLQELDARFGYSRGYLSRLLKGETALTFRHVFMLLDALDLSRNEFFSVMYPPPPRYREREDSPREAIERLIRRLDRYFPGGPDDENPEPPPVLPDTPEALEERIVEAVRKALAAGRPRPRPRGK